MNFSGRFCKFYKTGLHTPRCMRNNNPAHDSCEGECEHWINEHDETHEEVLHRIVFQDVK